MPTLTEQEQNLCEGKLQENEVAPALKLMKNGSTPGCDGITTVFYKVFWTNIKSMLKDSYIFSHDKGQVSQTQQRGITSLIHKGKDTYTQREGPPERQTYQLETNHPSQHRLQNPSKNHSIEIEPSHQYTHS